MLRALRHRSLSAALPLAAPGARAASSYASAPKLSNPSLWRATGYLNGEWTAGPSSSSGEFEIINPGTGETIGTLPEMGVEETKLAIQHATAAGPSWAMKSEYERGAILQKMFLLMKENAEDLAQIITAENGKPLVDARGEIAYGASFLEWFAAEAVRNYGDIIPSSVNGTTNLVIKQPIGVCGIITPWNFPNAMVTRKLGAALAAGCTVVMKAPSETPYSVLAIARIAEKAGVPPGVVNVILSHKSVAAVGQELCENPDVKKISFTGSTRVGKILMQQSSGTLKKLSLELGGNGPLIVFGDADLDKAIAGTVLAKFRLSGQTCVCANRIFVHSSVYDAYATKLAAAISNFKVGLGTLPGITHGPLIHQAAVDKVERHVASAVSSGGKVLVGGERGDGQGYFWKPTLVGNVGKSDIDQEETFGPLAALYSFETEEEVLKRANDTEVGLAGYFFSENYARISRVASALQVGLVGANTGGVSQAGIPFGGIKESGFGREGSKYGMEPFQSMKMVAIGGL